MDFQFNESVQYHSNQISFCIIPENGEKIQYGHGDFHVTNKRVIFANDDGRWELTFEEIGVHALSRDPQNFGAPCLYCQPISEEIIQWVFIPTDPECLDSLFEVFTRCAALAPAPPEEEEDNEFYTADDFEDD